MTVTTELSRSTFPWTGVETAFACAWPADQAADVKVFYRTAAGVVSEMTAGVNHSVTLADGTNLVTVLPIALPAAPGTLVVFRETPALVQETLQDGEGFSLLIIQKLHDRAAMRSSEDRTTFSRAIVLEEGAELGAGNFNLGGSGLSNVAPGTLPTDAATVGQMLAILVGTGNVPTPLPSDVTRVLQATAPGLFGWGPEIHTVAHDLLAAATVAAQREALQITAAGELLLLATDVATQRLALGGGATGISVFQAASPAVARRAMSRKTVLAKTAGYTVDLDDIGNTIIATSVAALTIALPKVADAGDGFCISVRNAGTGLVTIDPDGAETVNGSAALVLYAREAVELVCDGAAWHALFQGMPPGSVVQTVAAPLYTSYFTIDATASPAQAIPADDSKPQQTEGVQVNAQAITPRFASSILRARAEILGSGNANSLCAALFRDAGADAIGVDIRFGAGSFIAQLEPKADVVAGSTNATTFKMRVGPSSGVGGFNGNTVSRLMGGLLGATLIIEEIKT